MTAAVQAYRHRSEQAQRDELILSHLYLVRHVLGKLLVRLPERTDVENLEAAGVLGLVEAANNFHPARGIKFKTYAYLRVRGAILDELRRNCPLPQRTLERLGKIRSICAAGGPATTLEQVAAAIQATPDEVTDCFLAVPLLYTVPLDGLQAARLMCRDDPGDEAQKEERAQLLAQAVAALPERERLVVTLYYLEDLRLKEIGRLLHLSESRVSRILADALFQIGQFMRRADE